MSCTNLNGGTFVAALDRLIDADTVRTCVVPRLHMRRKSEGNVSVRVKMRQGEESGGVKGGEEWGLSEGAVEEGRCGGEDKRANGVGQ